MSSVVIAGDTSGSITVSAPAVAGSNTLTLPAATGTVIYADGSGNLQANSGYGSVATGYLCRAWVNFNGTGTVAIRASGNVTSITDNGIGDYTLNFTVVMPDANYTPVCMTQNDDSNGARGAGGAQINQDTAPTTSALRIFTAYGATATTNGSKNDQARVCIAVFR